MGNKNENVVLRRGSFGVKGTRYRYRLERDDVNPKKYFVKVDSVTRKEVKTKEKQTRPVTTTEEIEVPLTDERIAELKAQGLEPETVDREVEVEVEVEKEVMDKKTKKKKKVKKKEKQKQTVKMEIVTKETIENKTFEVETTLEKEVAKQIHRQTLFCKLTSSQLRTYVRSFVQSKSEK